MKPGKVTQTIYRRSILKQLHTDKEVALFAPSQEEHCYGIQSAGGQMLSASVSLYGNEKDLCVFAMAKAVNELATRGASPSGVGIQILLPDFAYESRLKMMIAMAETAAEEQNLQILHADAQVVPGIQTTIVNVTAVGNLCAGRLFQSNMAKAEQEIVLLKWMGLEGSLRVKRAREEELKGRFISTFLDKLEASRKEIFSASAIETAAAVGVSAMHQIGDGGILAALWELAESAGIGLSVDMRKIAVKQETIEVCEYFHLNPYQLTSTGSILVVTEKGEELVDTLKESNVEAVIIGRTAKGNERVLMNGEEKRYLDRSAPDELAVFYSKMYE